MSNLKKLTPETEPKPSPKRFKDYEPGYMHVDLKYLPKVQDEEKHQYLYVAIDRATRWVYLDILPDKKASTASSFLRKLCKMAPCKIKTILTDNGKEFTDRFCATGQREPTGNHAFDIVCEEQGIEHRLIKAKHPQTNGMVERFNGRIADILKKTIFESAIDLRRTLFQYQKIYNQSLPQKALGHRPPMAKMKEYYKIKPELFNKRPINRQGLDIYFKKSVTYQIGGMYHRKL